MTNPSVAGDYFMELVKELYSYTDGTGRYFDFRDFINEWLFKGESDFEHDEEDLKLLIHSIEKVCEIDYKSLYLHCTEGKVIETFILKNKLSELLGDNIINELEDSIKSWNERISLNRTEADEIKEKVSKLERKLNKISTSS